jgi:endoglucanase
LVQTGSSMRPAPIMQNRILPAIVILLVCAPFFANAQEVPVSPAWRRAEHLRHGVNASEWFAQSLDYGAQRLSTYTTLDDISLMRKLGFDHVRLSVDPVIFDCPGPWQQCERVQALDLAVAKALAEGLAVVIDLHPDEQFKRHLATDDFSAEKFRLLWGSIAEHVAALNPELVVFEILNEPEDKDQYRWSGTEARIIEEIRRRAPRHTIIVSGAEYSDIGNLMVLPQFKDDNLIYNFHYYEPHLFTHQGANWGVPFWVKLRDVPYPLTPRSVDKAVSEQDDSLAKWELTETAFGQWNRDRILAEMRFAADWAKTRHVPLTCNEFGVYRNFADPDARARWIEDVRAALEQNNIGWTMWDYRGGFGVVTKEAGASVPDARILHALGLR